MGIERTIFVFLVLCFVKVNCMSLDGPPLTRYDPCGLGIIHFDRFNLKFWQGVMNLGLYSDLTEVNIGISFKRKIKIYGATHNTTFAPSNDWHDYKILIKSPLPTRYVFYFQLENLKNNESDIPIVTQFSLNNVTMCDDSIKATQSVDSLNVSRGKKHYQHVCGRRSLDHTELVSVRTESKAGDWPWHVAILINSTVTNQIFYNCGGSIISRTAVVTAGHCVSGKKLENAVNRVIIVAGVDDHTEFTQVGRQSLKAEKIIIHPGYVAMEATSDLAVIKVNRFKFTEYVQPVCLWGPVFDKTILFGQQATVVGFGWTEDSKKSVKLRSAYTKIQNDSVCVEYAPKVYKPLMNEFTFCAGYGPNSKVNPRNGDSGGGLVLATMQPDDQISWFLRGVLSKCGVAPNQTECDPRYYVVYTDVGPHYGWLYKHSGLRFRDNIL